MCGLLGCTLLKRVVRNEVEDGSTERRAKSLTRLTEPQGIIKNPQGKFKNGCAIAWYLCC